MNPRRFSSQFVEYVPDDLAEGVLYVSISYAVAAHRCACGCGQEVVTPLSPTDWKIIFDGESVSLDPSIGNWSFPCRSHYFIRNGKVQWAGNMTDAEIRRGRLRDRASKDAHYAKKSGADHKAIEGNAVDRSEEVAAKQDPRSRWAWLARLFR